MDKIIELMKEYCDNNKYADRDFYKRLFEIYKEIISFKVNNLLFINKNSDSKYNQGYEALIGIASYSFENNELIIYEDNVKDAYDNYTFKELNEHDKVVYYNACMLQILMHEFEHIYQEYKMRECNDQESEVFKFFNQNPKETNITYIYSLLERLAEYNSLEKIMIILKEVNFESSIIYESFEKFKEELISQGYGYFKGDYISREGTYQSSTDRYVYLKGFNQDKYHELMFFIDTKELRIQYGMLTEEEYLELNEQEKKL